MSNSQRLLTAFLFCIMCLAISPITLFLVSFQYEWSFRFPPIDSLERTVPQSKSDSMKVTEQLPGYYQDIINEYVDAISSKDYFSFNDDITIRTLHGPIIFSKISHKMLADAVRNTSIMVFGDSLSKYFIRFLSTQVHLSQLDYVDSNITFLTNLWNESLIPYPSRLQWEDPIVYYFRRYDGNDKYTEIVPWGDGIYVKHQSLVFPKINTKLQFHGKWVNSIPNYDYFDSEVLSNYANLSVIISDFSNGHLTHLYPWRHPEHYHLRHVLNLEIFFDKFIEYALKYHSANLKCIIFRSTNPCCSDPLRYDKPYQDGARFYVQNYSVDQTYEELKNFSVFRGCLQELGLEGNKTYANEKGEPVAMGYELCGLNYSLTDAGQHFLNERFQRYVFKKQKEVDAKHGVKIIYYDSYKLYLGLESVCREQFHYPMALPVQGMVVGNIIKHYCK